MSLEHIPRELIERPQWVLWKLIDKVGHKTKVPFQANGAPASTTNPETWCEFSVAKHAMALFDGLGFVFAEDDEFAGIDFDGCRDPETGKVSDWAREWIVALDSYAEVSPSKSGVKVFVRAKAGSGRKLQVSADPCGGKTAAVECYDRGRYFCVTGLKLKGLPATVEPRQEVLDKLLEHFAAHAATPSAPVGGHFYAEAAVVERARKYIARMPVAVSGQGGHNAAFHVACVLLLGFGLHEANAWALLCEWNQVCQPPWSERELRHKLDSAAKQPGERNYLRNVQPTQWAGVSLPEYAEPEVKSVTLTTLQAGSQKYLDELRRGGRSHVETGLPELDYALSGGVEFGEMVVIAARPSHAKSCAVLQAIHHMTASGLPALIVSEEMSALALGKRTIQFASDIHEEHWATDIVEVERHVQEHFAMREPCYVAESVGNVEAVSELLHKAVKDHSIRVAAVDYAQLLGSRGRTRYEQVTNVSIALRKCATELQIVLLVVCQMSREIEKRQTFVPAMSDLKDTGQLEQDADVIVFQCWPHRLDPRKDPKDFLFFVAKNRNRAINTSIVECTFNPSRQMLLEARGVVEEWDVPAATPPQRRMDW